MTITNNNIKIKMQKKIFSLPLYLFAILLCLSACTDDAVDGLSGKYDLDTYQLTQVSSQTTTKIGKGVKRIEMSLTDGSNILQLSFGSKEWTLPATTYTYAPSADNNYDSAVGNGNFAAKLTDASGNQIAMSSNTSITVSKGDDGNYEIVLISINDDTKNVKCLYKGQIDFFIGEDDPVASGYTISINENAVTDANKKVYADLTKYAITVNDPNGTNVAEFDAVRKSGLSMANLVGTYTIQSYPTAEGLMDNGWVVYYPQMGYKFAGGTYFTDDNNAKQYVTSGTITITEAKDANDTPLYSFSGSDLSMLTATNEASKGGSFKILFSTFISSVGTVLKDQTIHSDVMNMDMKYSVYLPNGWDGTKTYPVLYLLHGADGSNNDWLTGGAIDSQLNAAISTGTAKNMIVIMPNGTVDKKNLFYCDNYQGDAKYMTFFFTEFLPKVEAMYKVKSDRSHRAVGGLSMGGYGSLYYGLLHPEMFCYVYACSPATYIDGTPNLYDLLKTSTAANEPGITIEIGTSDFLYDSSKYFKAALDQCKITNEYITRDGTHDWAFWRACTPKIVKKVSDTFAN
jgi:enterochelin esterase-like enzyme